MKDKKTATTEAEAPLNHYQDSQSVGAMGSISGSKKDEIVNRQLCHWFKADAQLAMEIAKGLGVEIDPKLLK